jgi:hypothetical protein
VGSSSNAPQPLRLKLAKPARMSESHLVSFVGYTAQTTRRQIVRLGRWLSGCPISGDNVGIQQRMPAARAPHTQSAPRRCGRSCLVCLFTACARSIIGTSHPITVPASPEESQKLKKGLTLRLALSIGRTKPACEAAAWGLKGILPAGQPWSLQPFFQTSAMPILPVQRSSERQDRTP